MNNLKTQVDAAIYFIERLDIEMLNDILDSDLRYQRLEKKVFLYKLNLVFKEFKSSGDNILESFRGNCNGCNNCNTGFSFIAKKSKLYIDLIIQSKNDKVIDIFECFDLKNEEVGVKKKLRLYIEDIPF